MNVFEERQIERGERIQLWNTVAELGASFLPHIRSVRTQTLIPLKPPVLEKNVNFCSRRFTTNDDNMRQQASCYLKPKDRTPRSNFINTLSLRPNFRTGPSCKIPNNVRLFFWGEMKTHSRTDFCCKAISIASVKLQESVI